MKYDIEQTKIRLNAELWQKLSDFFHCDVMNELIAEKAKLPECVVQKARELYFNGSIVAKAQLVSGSNTIVNVYLDEFCSTVVAQKQSKGYVYFLLHKILRLLKIGFTEHFDKRPVIVRHGLAGKADLIGTIPGTRSTEASLHSYFEEYKDHSSAGKEWFHWDPIQTQIINLIKCGNFTPKKET